MGHRARGYRAAQGESLALIGEMLGMCLTFRHVLMLGFLTKKPTSALRLTVTVAVCHSPPVRAA